MAQGISSPLIGVDEAARILGLSSSTLYAWVERRPPAIPHLRLGRSVRFDPDELAAWVDRQRQGASA